MSAHIPPTAALTAEGSADYFLFGCVTYASAR
ncbi:hypothetical protein DES53_103398 [Roseimicrobium gellanilyticum]|uniref:Uncharacterized protein n=1 Tax=Roseimicrobium gellanilyticum TaxID=748857 RepID=A0A366HRJ8_9BACT|nr:hypothetical protein DES53_103398 [Roseimicrobium gellanilyticum]